ncbi:MAG: T9SS type A sorting domain-containing protein [Candidatus Aegiribacteria sp.]|nr:T9SS type A sorting domain-containing protein [Candidatus Aegiribacteria sp.]
MNHGKTHKQQVSFIIFLLFLLSGWQTQVLSQGIIIDHGCTDITQIPESAINQAKSNLHIAYGHTSHGSQLTTGMNGLVDFANGGGLGLSLPYDIFEWNNGGSGGALDLHDYAMSGDCGYYPAWYNNTVAYLNNPDNSDVNVIIWSWCGQAADRTEQEMIDTYLDPMTALEGLYPNVTFVYMTGHANATGETGNLHLRNQQIRNYCITNSKVLYDFYDIECYDPDDSYFGDKYVNDDCSYTGGNWAIEWQNTHVEGVDWYNCTAAHTQPLNANRKAYAAWWLWAILGGWQGTGIAEQETVYDYSMDISLVNPSLGTASISCSISEQLNVRIDVYSCEGRLAQTPFNGEMDAGDHELILGDLHPGMYLVVMRSNDLSVSDRLIILR